MRTEAERVELANPEGFWLPDWSPLPRSGRLEATLTLGEDSDSDPSEAPYEPTPLMSWSFYFHPGVFDNPYPVR